MTFTADNNTKLGDWWSLTDTVQNTIKRLVPDQNAWTLNITKTDRLSWVFSLPRFLTFNEALTNGTELVLDYHFEQLTGRKPQSEDTMIMTVSKVELADYTTKCLHWAPDDNWAESNWYIDHGSQLDVWLCPYLQVLFKEVPKELWIKLIPTSPTL